MAQLVPCRDSVFLFLFHTVSHPVIFCSAGLAKCHSKKMGLLCILMEKVIRLMWYVLKEYILGSKPPEGLFKNALLVILQKLEPATVSCIVTSNVICLINALEDSIRSAF